MTGVQTCALPICAGRRTTCGGRRREAAIPSCLPSTLSNPARLCLYLAPSLTSIQSDLPRQRPLGRALLLRGDCTGSLWSSFLERLPLRVRRLLFCPPTSAQPPLDSLVTPFSLTRTWRKPNSDAVRPIPSFLFVLRSAQGKMAPRERFSIDT